MWLSLLEHAHTRDFESKPDMSPWPEQAFLSPSLFWQMKTVKAVAATAFVVHIQPVTVLYPTKLACCLVVSGLRIEESTAKFYLDVAEGNLKDAIALYEQDVAWEQKDKAKRGAAPR